jgi:hypothetical protein
MLPASSKSIRRALALIWQPDAAPAFPDEVKDSLRSKGDPATQSHLPFVVSAAVEFEKYSS